MANLDDTRLFNLDDMNKLSVRETLTIVYNTLAEKGYDPVNQIVGYLISGDPAYVPRDNDARNLIRLHERDEIMERLVEYFMNPED